MRNWISSRKNALKKCLASRETVKQLFLFLIMSKRSDESVIELFGFENKKIRLNDVSEKVLVEYLGGK